MDISSKCIQCFAVKEGVDCSLEANGRLSFRVVLVSFVRCSSDSSSCVRENRRVIYVISSAIRVSFPDNLVKFRPKYKINNTRTFNLFSTF